MKKYPRIVQIIIPILFIFSCDWPKTVVTNYVHPDGSVTRRVVMNNNDDMVDPVNYRVPVDSTWTFSETFEIKDKDTTWIITAEKHFRSVEEINLDYEADQGVNKILKRRAGFKKKFAWFNTYYSYSEKISKMLNVEVKADDFFSPEDLKWFYMPEPEIDSLLKSADSLRYKSQKELVDSISERYLLEALIREWTVNYLKIVPDSEFIHSRKDLLVDSGIGDKDQDSIFMDVLGEDYYKLNKTALDNALTQLDSTFSNVLSSKFYTLEMLMPGKLVSSNGFEHKDGRVSWAVDSKYFVSQDYIMHAESKIFNRWAWVVTSLAALILIVLFMNRYIKK